MPAYNSDLTQTQYQFHHSYTNVVSIVGIETDALTSGIGVWVVGSTFTVQ